MKPWYRSKTIWFNLGAAALPVVAAGLEPLRPFMTPLTFAVVGLAVAVVNVFLRTITTTGITTDKE